MTTRTLFIVATIAILSASANAEDRSKQDLKDLRQLSTEQRPGGPTLGKCMAAVSDAQQHDNTWQETEFSMQECRDIAAKSIDVGGRLLEDSAHDDE